MMAGCLTALMLVGTVDADPELRAFFDALRHVETGGEADPATALGDRGRSFGPYQISRAYWKDSGVKGRYTQVRDSSYAELVMVAYWARYRPTALRNRDWETLARIHNGGPKGDRYRGTLKYWRRVQHAMQDRSDQIASVTEGTQGEADPEAG